MKHKSNANTDNCQQLLSIYYVLSIIWLNMLYSIANLILI